MLAIFYQEGDGGSARVLTFIEEHGIQDLVVARDIAFADARAAFDRLRGSSTPALWDGERMHQGAEAVLARLMAFLNVGRAD